MAPLRTGLALAITVGVFYALCALVWGLVDGHECRIDSVHARA